MSSHAIPAQPITAEKAAPIELAMQSVMSTPWIAVGEKRDLPKWAIDLLDVSSNGTTTVEGMRHHQLVISDATSLAPREFTAHVRQAYAQMLADIDLESIFRIWNFIPRIGEYDEDGLNRYMRFNAARFEAFEEHSGGRSYPPASGVGHAGNDLVVHLLEGARSVHPVKNSRQILPRDYSKIWGPLPPVFARAAIVECSDDCNLLLVSGTASINGEDTAHPGDLQSQLDETFANLDALFDAANLDDRQLDSLLVYVTQPKDIPVVQERLHHALFARKTEIEIRIGPLCRGDLLVEIEGFRRLGPRTQMT